MLPGWLQPFLTTPTPVFFSQLLISVVNMKKLGYFIHFVPEMYLI